MALRYNGITIGKLTVEQELGEVKSRFNLQIRQGNCLAVIIHVRKCTEEEMERHPNAKYLHTLHTFFINAEHMKRLVKTYGSVLDGMDKVISCELNMYYKECWTLLKYFTQSGYKVKCYYKEPKKK